MSLNIMRAAFAAPLNFHSRTLILRMCFSARTQAGGIELSLPDVEINGSLAVRFGKGSLIIGAVSRTFN
ncbi:hypothetical protein [Erwinia sp. S59]|uniref:hypothetical protein n=1 Tax=Erwinia sp. S59 TaxID=2769340 RepID=UPI00190C0500|nr:hypothetical protein [Erwinia sp. S59]MBK0091311.1 hypothetical protein [Erwinia sp. S59]